MTNYKDRAAELKSKTDSQIKSIQSDKDLTQAAKVKRIAEIREQANKKLVGFQNEHAKTKAEKLDSLKRNLFGLGGLSLTATDGDKASARQNYRDALFRADSIADENAALRMLERARTTGDKELAKAIALRAYENGWNRALNDYAGQSEAIQSNLQELIDYERNIGNPGMRITESMSFTPIRETPEETKARLSGQAVSGE